MAESEEVLDLRRRARRRLIGATALVLFLVVVPPWLMDLEPRPVVSNLSVEIPGKDAPKLDPRNVPVLPLKVEPDPAKSQAGTPPAGPAPSPSSTVVEPKPAPAVPVAPAKSSEPGKAAAEVDAAKAAKAAKSAEVAVAKPAPAPAKPDADAERAAAILKNEVFYFQLGAFNNRDNAKAVQQKAAQAGVKAATETAEVKGVEQTRVVAGPFPSREAAEKARTRMKEAGIEPGPVRSR